MTIIHSITGKNRKKQLLLLLAIFWLAVWGTRLSAMRHEITLQPDEQVFYNAASSVVYPDYTFRQVRDYPSGAFVFQMPFQFAGRVVSLLSSGGATESDQNLVKKEAGRIASVFYFSMGFLLGAVILWRNFGRRLSAVFLYCLTMLFSLFQIEQSRYGTGDPISFFLLTAILFAIDLFLREKNGFYLYLSSFCAGILTAVKFPLVFFAVFPAGALALYVRQKDAPKASALKPCLMMFVSLLAGLLLFSPQFYVDPAFFMKAFFVEFDAYMISGNPAVLGTPPNHLVSAVLYQLLYSDFPFALPLAVYGAVRLHKNNREHAFTNPFFTLVVPVSLLVFFICNLFTKTMFMRTFYPYYCLCVLYTAYGAWQLMRFPRLKWAVLALAALMSLRGGYLVYALSGSSPVTPVAGALTSHEKWEERTMTVMLDDEFIAGGRHNGPSSQKYMYPYMSFASGVPEVKPGEFVIAGPMAYGYAQKRIFPTGNKPVEAICENWEAFRVENAPYRFAAPYPDAYHYLFGSWIMGTTLAHYEFPTNYLYHKPLEDGALAWKAKEYNAMRTYYGLTDYGKYLENLAGIDGCVVITAKLGCEQMDLVDGLVSSLTGEEDGIPYYGSDILVFQSGEGVIHYEALADERRIMLEEFVGIDCEILFRPQSDVITVDGRTYTFYEQGYHLVVYDMDLGCVVGWATLQQNEDGTVVLSTTHDNNGNMAI